jgi:AraC-like DNA-binding protein
LYESVPRVEPKTVTLYSELLRELAIAASSTREPFDESADQLSNQSRINEYLQELKQTSLSARFAAEDPAQPAYPFEKEGRLLDQIRRGEVSVAQKTLNELLVAVFFESGSRMEVVRARAQELVVLLSRAVLTEGADPEEVFGLNYTFVDAIGNQEDINGIAYWMARIVRRFADLVLYLPHLGHSRVLRRVVRHLRANLSRPVPVREAAEIAGLSESHFSRVFHEEIGETFVSYARRIRCEAAAEMLRQTDLPVQEVAARCGYEDHSYFSRVFRKTMGRSPTQVREGAPI